VDKNEKVELLLIGGYFVLGSRMVIVTADRRIWGMKGMFAYQIIKPQIFPVAFRSLSNRFPVALKAMPFNRHE
jgi:hypothetical protein